MKNVYLGIDAELGEELRMYCKEKDYSISRFVNYLIRDYIVMNMPEYRHRLINNVSGWLGNWRNTPVPTHYAAVLDQDISTVFREIKEDKKNKGEEYSFNTWGYRIVLEQWQEYKNTFCKAQKTKSDVEKETGSDKRIVEKSHETQQHITDEHDVFDLIQDEYLKASKREQRRFKKRGLHLVAKNITENNLFEYVGDSVILERVCQKVRG